MAISVELQPKQIELYKAVISNDHTIIGYGGSAGGAKSHGIRDVSVILSGEYAGIKIGFFRRKHKELLSNHIIPFFAKYPQLAQYYNKSEKILYYPNGSITRFGSADIEDAIYDYQGDEFDVEFIDEATHFTQGMIEFLMTRNRSPLLDFQAKMVLTMNPGNIGHAYIKRVFIDKQYTENEDPKDYYFIPAKIYDNAVWVLKQLRKDGISVEDYYSWEDLKKKEYCLTYSEYAKRLSKLPEQLKLAYLEGDWDVFGGQFFREFRREKQIIQPFSIPNQWVFFRAECKRF